MSENGSETEVDGCFGNKRKSRNLSGNHLIKQGSEETYRRLNDRDLREIFKDEVDNKVKIDPIYLNMQAEDSGNTFLLLAAWGSKLQEIKTLLENGADPLIRNFQGESLVTILVEQDNESEILNEIEPVIKNKEAFGFELFCKSLESGNFSMAIDTVGLLPDCLGFIDQNGKSVIHAAYDVLDSLGKCLEDNDKEIAQENLEHQSNISSIIDCCLVGMPETSLISKDYRKSILEILVITNNIKAIKTIFNRFKGNKEFLIDFCNQTNEKGATPIEEIFRITNDPKKGEEMIELISNNGGKIEKAVTNIIKFPDEKVFENIIRLRDAFDIDPVNYQDFEDGSAFHYALKTSNGYLDVPKYLDMLLNNGANIMAIWTRRPFNQTDTERTTERSLPLNIALEMQYSPDNKNGRTRCDEYFQALNKYGIEKIFNNLEKDPEVRKSFLIEHLTVAAYRSDYQTVNSLLHLVRSGNHYTESILESYQLGCDVLLSERRITYSDLSDITKNSILHWMAEGVNKHIMMEIVKTLYMLLERIGEEARGLKAIQKLHRNSNLKIKAAVAYKELMGPKGSPCEAFMGVFFEIILFNYIFLFLDMYFDIDLILNYQAMVNETSNETSFTFSSFSSDSNNHTINLNSRLAGIWPISASVVTFSVLGYVVTSCISVMLPKSLVTSGWTRYLGRMLKPIIFLFSHPYWAFKSKLNRDNAEYRIKYKEGRRAWIKIGRIEVCLEATIQLLIQLYILPAFSDTFTEWYESGSMFKHFWNGLGYLVSFTNMKAEFEDIMFAKYLVSSFFLCHRFSIFRLQKKSQRWADSKETYFSYMSSAMAQLAMRSFTLYNLFKLDKTMISVLILVHYILTFALKVIFEVVEPFESSRTFFRSLVNAIVASFGSTLVYINIDNSDLAVKYDDVKRSVFPVICHFGLVLIEHIGLMCYVLPNEYQIFLPIGFWILGLLMIGGFYNFCNKARIFGGLGPLIVSEREGEEEVTDITGWLKSKCCERQRDAPTSTHISYKAVFCFEVRNLCGRRKKTKKGSIASKESLKLPPFQNVEYNKFSTIELEETNFSNYTHCSPTDETIDLEEQAIPIQNHSEIKIDIESSNDLKESSAKCNGVHQNEAFKNGYKNHHEIESETTSLSIP